MSRNIQDSGEIGNLVRDIINNLETQTGFIGEVKSDLSNKKTQIVFEIKKLRSLIELLIEQFSKFEEQISILKGEKSQLELNIKLSAEEVEKLTIEIRQLIEEKKQIQIMYDELLIKIQDGEVSAQECSGEIKKLQEIIQTLNITIEELRAEISSLNVTINEWSLKYQELEIQIRNCEDEKIKISSQYQECEEDRKQFIIQKQELEQQIIVLQTEIREYKKEIIVLREEIEALKSGEIDSSIIIEHLREIRAKKMLLDEEVARLQQTSRTELGSILELLQGIPSQILDKNMPEIVRNTIEIFLKDLKVDRPDRIEEPIEYQNYGEDEEEEPLRITGRPNEPIEFNINRDAPMVMGKIIDLMKGGKDNVTCAAFDKEIRAELEEQLRQTGNVNLLEKVYTEVISLLPRGEYPDWDEIPNKVTQRCKIFANAIYDWVILVHNKNVFSEDGAVGYCPPTHPFLCDDDENCAENQGLCEIAGSERASPVYPTRSSDRPRLFDLNDDIENKQFGPLSGGEAGENLIDDIFEAIKEKDPNFSKIKSQVRSKLPGKLGKYRTEQKFRNLYGMQGGEGETFLEKITREMKGGDDEYEPMSPDKYTPESHGLSEEFLEEEEAERKRKVMEHFKKLSESSLLGGENGNGEYDDDYEGVKGPYGYKYRDNEYYSDNDQEDEDDEDEYEYAPQNEYENEDDEEDVYEDEEDLEGEEIDYPSDEAELEGGEYEEDAKSFIKRYYPELLR